MHYFFRVDLWRVAIISLPVFHALQYAATHCTMTEDHIHLTLTRQPFRISTEDQENSDQMDRFLQCTKFMNKFH